MCLQELLSGLETLEWPSSVKAMQTEWIGKSEGAYFDFQLRHTPNHAPSHAPSSQLPGLRVFTTKPETMFGVTFIAISPEHELLLNTEVYFSVHFMHTEL